ncbi:MAG: glycosyltransferase family 2 protein [Bacteroidia bacterium]|nr:glycosyltransferase family 2 protein [Bacteroidia bacterium]
MLRKNNTFYPRIGIIIPVFNRIKSTIECLKSLDKIDYPNYRIIVIDDGSTDATWDTITMNYLYVLMIKGDGNLWWSKATNLGIIKAIEFGFEYVLFLNNDDEVDKDILKNLVRCAIDNPNSIVAAKVRDFINPDIIVFAGSGVDWKMRGTYRIGSGEIDKGQYDQRKDIEWIPGSGTFLNTHYFKKIGFIDAKTFPQYGADIDFTLRARKAGYRIVFEPKALIWKKLETTGIISSQMEPTFRTFFDALVSLRSPLNIKRQVRLLWRHCPKKYILKQLFRTYYSFYRGLLAEVIKNRFPYIAKLTNR